MGGPNIFMVFVSMCGNAHETFAPCDLGQFHFQRALRFQEIGLGLFHLTNLIANDGRLDGDVGFEGGEAKPSDQQDEGQFVPNASQSRKLHVANPPRGPRRVIR